MQLRIMGRRRKICVFICVLPFSLCCAYFLCVYSVVFMSPDIRRVQQDFLRLENKFELLRDNPLKWYDLTSEVPLGLSLKRSPKSPPRPPNKGLHSSKYTKLRPSNISLSIDEAFLHGFRTDVDRTEDRKKKKLIEKLRRGLAERCQKMENEACDELTLLEAEIKNGTLVVSKNNSLILPNSYNNYSGNVRQWNPYADKGFTIVGQRDSLQRRLPQVLIIGAKKAGTRALLEFLRLHPSVTAAGTELHFFDRYYYRGPAWYRSKLPPSLEGQLTVEKTPAYFVDKDVPQRVHHFIPSVRLLLVVRDPVIRAISDFAQSLSKHEKHRTFRDSVLKNATSGLVNVAWGPVRGGLYARHFLRWRKYFPMTSIHVISGERLVTDPAGEMSDVQDFLNIEKVINDRHFYFNTTKGFPCLVKREKNGKPHCLGYSKGRSHPIVDEDTIRILKDFYRPFNRKFYKLVGRNFGWD